MYSKNHGRFTTTDSVGPDLSNPQTLNKYQYCLNNPLRYIDKNGKYEEDVHRDLTRELAYAAGFSMRQATAIGSENQYIDDGPTNPVGYGPEAYRARSKHHFTTEEQRNSLWADFENAAKNSNETNQLMRLGTYLHAQQDSFSHEGYGPLLGQATDLFKDGIIPSYEAASRVDKTDSDPAKAERMAEDTFKRLVSARNTLAGTGRSGSFYRPISYGAIKPLVARWVRESDPQKKAAILGEIRRKIQNGRDVQDFPKNVVNPPKRKKQEEE
jgi:hypothetical protein